MILFLDTETTGLYQRPLAHSHPAQPDLVQLGLVLCSPDGVERASFEAVVRQGVVGDAATKVHGITTGMSHAYGFKLETVMAVLGAFAAKATRVVAHNLDFDERVLATAAYRAGRGPLALPTQRTCTCELTGPVLKLPATARMAAAGYGDQYKKPSLVECHTAFFGEGVTGAHTALADARACARVYFHMVLNEGKLWRRRNWFQRVVLKKGPYE